MVHRLFYAVALLAVFLIGYYCGAAAERRNMIVTVIDYEDALASAQMEYDTLRNDASEWMARFETNEAVLLERLQTAWDTNEHLRRELDQKSAEVSRYKSLASFLSGSAY